MDDRPRPGDRVQTPLGKGTVREVRNGGRVLVDIEGRGLVFEATRVTPIEQTPQRRRRSPVPVAEPEVRPTVNDGTRCREVDLHGLTVDDALTRVDATLDACMRDDIAQLRVIHGRSGGKLRAALHRRLRGISSVRAFQLDARNPGVTIVRL